MKKIEIKIPEISENVESGLIASVLVSKGDRVEKDQSLVEVETDKATTDIPSTHSGTVEEIKVEEGDEVKVSQVIMILSVEEGEDEGEDSKKDQDQGDREEKDQKEDQEEGQEEDQEDQEEDQEEGQEEDQEEDQEEEEPEEKPSQQQKSGESKKGSGESAETIAATPLVKRIAREEGIDLKGISGTGPQGRITRSDLQSVISEKEKDEAQDQGAKRADQSDQKDRETERADDQRETREKMSTIRRLTAERMQESWQEIPHVTQFDQADITALEEFRQQQKSAIEKAGGKLTVTALLLKFTSFALQRFPRFNASLDEKAREIIYKHGIHIGVAVDTDRGLMVPVIREVNRKSLSDIARELNEIAEKARNKKISPDELQGGTFTVSNLGGIGGTAFTPIVYAPQVAILGVSQSRYQPVYFEEGLQKRLIMPLSLSYDHRVIDGAEGARFLDWICRALENPFAMLQ